MQLIRDPKQFDVMVTTNMFGDILSDEAAMFQLQIVRSPDTAKAGPDAKEAPSKTTPTLEMRIESSG